MKVQGNDPVTWAGVVSGKKTVENWNDAGWVTVGDSHQSRMIPFNAKNGIDTIAVSGGQISHCHDVLRKIDLRGVSTLFLLTGGNDVAKMGKKMCGIVEEFKRAIQYVSSVNKNCQVITGTVIPRGCGPDGGDHFIERMEYLDKLMKKFSPKHHHFLSDLFVGDPGLKGGPVSVMGEFYTNDKVHLNEKGVAKYAELMSFVMHAANVEIYKGREELRVRENFRVVFWKF